MNYQQAVRLKERPNRSQEQPTADQLSLSPAPEETDRQGEQSLLRQSASLSAANSPSLLDARLASLEKRAQEIVDLASSKGLPVIPIVVAPLFTGYRLSHGTKCDTVLLPLAEDPLFHDRDGFPVPKSALPQLKRIRDIGLHFDTLYVAHEIEKHRLQNGDPLRAELLAPPSASTQHLSHLLGRGTTLLWALAASPLALAVLPGAMAVGALAAMPLGLDPILLGVTVAPGRPLVEGEPAVWFYLAHWRYAERR